MAQDTNSRASMTYDAYKQFVDPIDITPKQQQQQFEEQKAKRRDELAKDLGSLTKHDLLPKVGEPVNQSIQQLKEGYVNGNITPDELRMGIVDVQQLISLGQNESDRAREILESDDPENWFYLDSETGLYERGLEAVKRVAYDGNGYGMSNEERIEALGTLNSSTGKLPEGNPRESIAARAKDLFMANATESQLEIVDSERMIGGETALFEISKVLGEDDRVRLIDNLSKDLAIKDRLKYEYYDSKKNEEMESEYGTFENFVKETINDYLPTRESEQRMQYSADDEVVEEDDELNESDFDIVVSEMDRYTQSDLLDKGVFENVTISTGEGSMGAVNFVSKPESKVLQITKPSGGKEIETINIAGKDVQIDRIVFDGKNGIVIGREEIPTTTKMEGAKVGERDGEDVVGDVTQKQKSEKVSAFELTSPIKAKLQSVYGVDINKAYKDYLSTSEESVVNPFEQYGNERKR